MDKYEKFSDLLKKKSEELVEKEINEAMINNSNLIEEKLKEYMDNYNNSKLDNLKNSVFNTPTNGRLRTTVGGANTTSTDGTYWGINGPTTPIGTGPYYPQIQNPPLFPGTYTYTTTSLDFIDPIDAKIKKLEKQIDLLLKFMVMKGLIESEDEFSDFLESVEVMDKLCEGNSKEGE